ncbi:MAG: hypothetical protein U9N42_01415 [Campylobacterota bacterium]|nr:hypothetical protein [Campylobacterota bacterium]
MKAYFINPSNRSISEIDYDGAIPNLYAILDSILINESHILHNHIIYCDKDAYTKDDSAFIVADYIFYGNAIICGHENSLDVDSTISLKELEELTSFDVSSFYLVCAEALKRNSIDIEDTFIVKSKDENLELNYNWVISTFNIAAQQTQDIFIESLQKALLNGSSIEEYFQKMGKLAIDSIE